MADAAPDKSKALEDELFGGSDSEEDERALAAPQPKSKKVRDSPLPPPRRERDRSLREARSRAAMAKHTLGALSQLPFPNRLGLKPRARRTAARTPGTTPTLASASAGGARGAARRAAGGGRRCKDEQRQPKRNKEQHDWRGQAPRWGRSARPFRAPPSADAPAGAWRALRGRGLRLAERGWQRGRWAMRSVRGRGPCVPGCPRRRVAVARTRSLSVLAERGAFPRVGLPFARTMESRDRHMSPRDACDHRLKPVALSLARSQGCGAAEALSRQGQGGGRRRRGRR